MRWLKAFIVYIGIALFAACIMACILGLTACMFSFAAWLAKTWFNDPSLGAPTAFALIVLCIGVVASMFDRQNGSELFDKIVLKWKYKLSNKHMQ